MLALLSSMPFESNQILGSLKGVRTTKIGGKTVYRGKFAGIDIILTITGIGKINAAHSITCVIEHFPVRQVINIGVGGAYPGSGLKIGDIAVAVKEILADEGVIDHQGWSSFRKIGIPLVKIDKRKYFNNFPMDKDLSKKAVKIFKYVIAQTLQKTELKKGNFVTVSAATGTLKRATEIERKFNALCENMEGAAIAQVCTIYRIPMIEIRGISNTVGLRDKRKWNLRLASENCQQVLLKTIKSLL
jgi:futalosine hydrolase